jgi:hypothetical protein
MIGVEHTTGVGHTTETLSFDWSHAYMTEVMSFDRNQAYD